MARRALYRKAVFATALLSALLPGIAARAAEAPAAAAVQAPEVDDRRILVMLKLGAEHYRAGADYGGGGYGDAVGEASRVRAARRIAKEHGLHFVENWPMPVLGIDCVIMEVPAGRSLETVTAELSALPDVAWSQPINRFHVEGAKAVPMSAGPNDQLYAAQPASQQWQLDRLHDFATGRGITIAVIDSRVDAAHPDLAGQISSSQNFAGEANRAAERHGTGVAGIIAARANNSVGIVGVAPGARVMALRACWERPGGGTVCDSLSIAKALSFAIDRHANIINLSLSGPDDRLIATLIGISIARGADVIAAVDSSRKDNGFPASVPGVIAVAEKGLSPQRGHVYIAPGADVPTTEPGGKWYLVNGSSYAAAHVSGLAALIQQTNRANGTHVATATALGTRGEINACASLARAGSLVDGNCSLAR